MTEVLGDFIRALRASDVRVSTSESIDAGNVVDLVGLDSRDVLRDGLALVLAKSEDEKQAFRETFDKFFSFEQFKSRAPGDAGDESDEASDDADEGSPQQGQAGGGAPGQGGGMEGEPSGAPAQMGDLVAMLESGDQAALQMALADAAREAQLNRIRLFTQRGL